MKYVKIARTTDLSSGEKKKITAETRQIMLANIESHYYAIDNTCPHMGGSLADGKLEGDNIVCPRHGSVFNVKTGAFVEGGKLFFIKIKAGNVHSYPVKVEGDDIFIGIE